MKDEELTEVVQRIYNAIFIYGDKIPHCERGVPILRDLLRRAEKANQLKGWKVYLKQLWKDRETKPDLNSMLMALKADKANNQIIIETDNAIEEWWVFINGECMSSDEKEPIDAVKAVRWRRNETKEKQ